MEFVSHQMSSAMTAHELSRAAPTLLVLIVVTHTLAAIESGMLYKNTSLTMLYRFHCIFFFHLVLLLLPVVISGGIDTMRFTCATMRNTAQTAEASRLGIQPRQFTKA